MGFIPALRLGIASGLTATLLSCGGSPSSSPTSLPPELTGTHSVLAFSRNQSGHVLLRTKENEPVTLKISQRELTSYINGSAHDSSAVSEWSYDGESYLGRMQPKAKTGNRADQHIDITLRPATSKDIQLVPQSTYTAVWTEAATGKVTDKYYLGAKK